MKKSIMLFMWGYQPLFRAHMEYHAKDVLQAIAPTVHPKALLVGIRTPEKTDGHPVCVEPEADDWDPRIFFNCAVRVEDIYNQHPDHSIFYGDEPSMRDKPENIRKKSVREAIQEVTSAYDLEHSTSTFCGWPTRVEGYHVVPILQSNKQELLEYPRLSAPIQFQHWISPVGLLESTIERLLEEAARALEEKEPGRFLSGFRMDTAALLRDAGSRFCTAMTFATGDVMLQGVFDSLNIISSLPYEGAGAIGELLFAPANIGAIDIRVSLNEPVRLHDHKLARKMIEMSGHDLSCVCHGSEGISGLGIPPSIDVEGVFRITFSGHYKWDLSYKDRLLMRVAFGVPKLPSVRLDEELFSSNVRRLLPGVDRNVEQRLWSILEVAMEQKHGTLIVVSGAAKEEAQRLNKQALGIKPLELTPSLVRRLSSIDGALLVDSKGICYAIGVILDGIATDDGDPSRGARYNSAVRYIASIKSPTMCLVVSEDSYVDLLPKLRPQVYKSEIENKTALLKTQNIDNYHKTRNWLDEHRFYLTAEQCDVVNKELARIHSPSQEVGEIRVPISAFVPDPTMNDSYYLFE